jgi:RNAse (barnase) inhibitor barstar
MRPTLYDSGLFTPHGPMNGAFRGGVRPGLRRLKADAVEGGWRVVAIDGRQTPTKAALLAELARVLKFPNWFGHNWDALADCLGDVAEVAVVDGHQGICLVWDHAEVLAATEPESVEAFREICVGDASIGWAVLLLARSPRRMAGFAEL